MVCRTYFGVYARMMVIESKAGFMVSHIIAEFIQIANSIVGQGSQFVLVFLFERAPAARYKPFLNSRKRCSTNKHLQSSPPNPRSSVHSSGTRDNPLICRPKQHVVNFGEVDLLSIAPLSISSVMAFGLLPSTWQPTLYAVPKISLTVPARSLEKDLNRMVRAISIISSRGTLFECLMFFSFFRSRGGSFKALMIREEAVGTTETAAWRF
ncbi:hypothetical protein F4777DRAFT_518733 [Nemania sp. FL0916]|nr:hypothetical protein F4777DRAFT_518733 [Nemania sp. FL0916]